MTTLPACVEGWRKHQTTALIYVLLVLMLGAMVIPLIWTILTSFKYNVDVTLGWIPPRWDGCCKPRSWPVAGASSSASAAAPPMTSALALCAPSVFVFLIRRVVRSETLVRMHGAGYRALTENCSLCHL